MTLLLGQRLLPLTESGWPDGRRDGWFPRPCPLVVFRDAAGNPVGEKAAGVLVGEAVLVVDDVPAAAAWCDVFIVPPAFGYTGVSFRPAEVSG